VGGGGRFFSPPRGGANPPLNKGPQNGQAHCRKGGHFRNIFFFSMGVPISPVSGALYEARPPGPGGVVWNLCGGGGASQRGEGGGFFHFRGGKKLGDGEGGKNNFLRGGK